MPDDGLTDLTPSNGVMISEPAKSVSILKGTPLQCLKIIMKTA